MDVSPLRETLRGLILTLGITKKAGILPAFCLFSGKIRLV